MTHRRLLGIAAEGLPLIAAELALAGLVAIRHRRLALLPLALAGLTAYFFRDPARPLLAKEGYLYAPADGWVTLVDQIEEERFIKGPACRIATFLSIFDVHINRSPVAGVVRYREHVSGNFRVAWQKEVSMVNERNYTGIETAHGPILVVQIAGLIARRIVCRPQVGDEVRCCQRIGLIMFGSRTDLIFPRDVARPLVMTGARVHGGMTPIGVWA